MKFCPYYFPRSRILGQSLPEIDFGMFHLFGSILSHALNRGIFQSPMALGTYPWWNRLQAAASSYCGSIIIVLQIIAGRVPDLPSDTYVYRCV